MAKTDARVRYTRRVIKETFLDLLAKKPVNRITVKEVCEGAEINRATFYAHYRDCFALLESIERELLDSFAASLRRTDPFDVKALIEAVYGMIETHEKTCRVLIFGGAAPSLLNRMIGLARESTLALWRRELHYSSENELEMLYTHLSNGLMHVVAEGYDRYPREEVIRFVNETAQKSLAPYR